VTRPPGERRPPPLLDPEVFGLIDATSNASGF